MHRFRLLLAAGPALLIAATVTGCTPTSSPAAPAQAPASSPAPDSAAAPDAAAQAAGGKATDGKATGGKAASSTTKRVACRSGDVEASLTAQDPLTTGATVRAMIIVTNTSKSTCRVDGWTTVSLLNASGAASPITISKVEQPGPAEPIDLKPGTSALAGLKWTQCDKGDETCPVGNSVEIGVPGAKSGSRTTLEGFPAPEKSGIAMKSVKLGPLQGSRQGVVAW